MDGDVRSRGYVLGCVSVLLLPPQCIVDRSGEFMRGKCVPIRPVIGHNESI